jgi:hypothetical protein
MFHLFKRAYLEFDYKMDSLGYDFLVATSYFGNFPMTAYAEKCLKPTSPSFEELLESSFENDIEKFWEFMYSSDNKIICYTRTDTIEKLMIQFFKSIFKHANSSDIFLLYQTMVESARVRSYIQTTAPDGRNKFLRDTFKLKTYEEFVELYNEQPISNFLRNDINKKDISFEFLLPDYFYNGTSSLFKDEILKRVKLISIDLWKDELEQLRLETIFGFLDMDRIDNNMNMQIGNIEIELNESELLKWMVDENFSADPSYIKRNYDYLKLVDQWDKMYDIWETKEDMKEVNDLIMAENWEALLERDINRNFGCLFTFELFREKSNQVFSSYCYRKKRNNLVSDLAPFRIN